MAGPFSNGSRTRTFVGGDMVASLDACDDLAEIAALAIALPNTANVAELLGNPRLEPLL